jgi:hypothetical protein
MIFGLARTDALRRTCLHGHYSGSDWAMNAAMAVQGRIVPVHDAVYYCRAHPDSLSARDASRRWWERSDFEAWFAPERAHRIVFAAWRRVGSYLRSAATAPGGPLTRALCVATVLRTALFDDRGYIAKLLVKDMLVAAMTVAANL